MLQLNRILVALVKKKLTFYQKLFGVYLWAFQYVYI